MRIVAKDDRSPRFCVDYRNTINKFLARETKLMLDIEPHIDTVAGAEYITVCVLQSAYCQIPKAKKGYYKTVFFVTSKGKYVFKDLPFGIANTPWVLQRMMSVAFVNFGQRSDLLVCMDDVIACSTT